jgi:hypothetical protein
MPCLTFLRPSGWTARSMSKPSSRPPGASRRNTGCLRPQAACRARTTSCSSIFRPTARAWRGSRTGARSWRSRRAIFCSSRMTTDIFSGLILRFRLPRSAWSRSKVWSRCAQAATAKRRGLFTFTSPATSALVVHRLDLCRDAAHPTRPHLEKRLARRSSSSRRSGIACQVARLAVTAGEALRTCLHRDVAPLATPTIHGNVIEGVRNVRYCEIIPIVRDGLTVYNTLGLNDCPVS